MAEITLTSANFDSMVLSSPVPVLVDFWASWCGPCRMLAPELSEIATAYEGKLTVGKVNVDEQGDLAKRFGVMSIPTLLLFKDGKLARQSIGYRPKAELEDMLKQSGI